MVKSRVQPKKEVSDGMKQVGVVLCSILILAICASVAPIVLADQQAPKPEFTIDYKSDFKKSIKPPVPFPHEKHFKDYGVKCDDCHHTYKDGKNVWKEGDPVTKCIECHPADRGMAKEKAKELGVKKLLDLKNAFHKNCQTCHKEENKQGKKAPVQCAECHKG